MMQKIIDYGVISASDYHHLIKMVNEVIELGFQPFGNLIVNNVNNHEWFYQAMVKYEEIN